MIHSNGQRRIPSVLTRRDFCLYQPGVERACVRHTLTGVAPPQIDCCRCGWVRGGHRLRCVERPDSQRLDHPAADPLAGVRECLPNGGVRLGDHDGVDEVTRLRRVLPTVRRASLLHDYRCRVCCLHARLYPRIVRRCR